MLDCKLSIAAILMAMMCWGCAPAENQGGERANTERLNIVATTGMIADLASNIGGELVEVTAIMGPGVDPHLYKASQGDLRLLRNADIIFYNGLHLEGKMSEVLEKLGRQQPVFAVAEGVPTSKLIKVDEAADSYDPHLWFDVSLWELVGANLTERLCATDTANATTYRNNFSAYRQSLQSLHQWVGEQLAAIPEGQRVLVTAHDAFTYFGAAYQMEVRGLQGISTLSEFGLRDISDLVGFLSEQKIAAVFVESSVPQKSLEAVVEGCLKRGHEVRIGGTLYSDAMGEAGTPEGSYIGMVRHNVNTIKQALLHGSTP